MSIYGTPPLKKMKIENVPSVDCNTLESIKSFSTGTLEPLSSSSLGTSIVKPQLGGELAFDVKPLIASASSSPPHPKKRSRAERDAANGDSRSSSPSPQPAAPLVGAHAAAIAQMNATSAALIAAQMTAAMQQQHSMSATTSAHSSPVHSRSSSPMPTPASIQDEQTIARQLLANAFTMQHQPTSSATAAALAAATTANPIANPITFSSVDPASSYHLNTPMLDTTTTTAADVHSSYPAAGAFVIHSTHQYKVFIMDFPKEIRKESSTKKSNIFLKRHAHFRIGVQMIGAFSSQPEVAIFFKRPADRTKTLETTLKGTPDGPSMFVYNGDLNESGMPRSFCKLKKNAKNNVFHLVVVINGTEMPTSFPFDIVAFKRDEKKRHLRSTSSQQKSLANSQKQLNDKMKAHKTTNQLRPSPNLALPSLPSSHPSSQAPSPSPEQMAQSLLMPPTGPHSYITNPAISNLLVEQLSSLANVPSNPPDLNQQGVVTLSQQLLALLSMQNTLGGFGSSPAC